MWQTQMLNQTYSDIPNCLSAAFCALEVVSWRQGLVRVMNQTEKQQQAA